MKTTTTSHQIFIHAAQKMMQLADNSIDLMVTSPPYPMIEMWDEIFSKQCEAVSTALKENKGMEAFEAMHLELDKVWAETNRVLKPGGFACVNIGDATRSINGNFALYPNHSRIITAFQNLGMANLPNIIWRKQTNAPNKFMGSGMLPAGAYVTLEHEWILIFRKGGKRQFKSNDEKLKRRQSSFFWEERNNWFSDIWDLKGTKQKIDKSTTRSRSAAFPFELPYRLINMYALQGDTVLDPFMGTGTTMLAAIAANRHSIGYEIDPLFLDIIMGKVENTPLSFFKNLVAKRLENHGNFVAERNADAKKTAFRHFNPHINMEVMTSQEKEINFQIVDNLHREANKITASYTFFQPNKMD